MFNSTILTNMTPDEISEFVVVLDAEVIGVVLKNGVAHLRESQWDGYKHPVALIEAGLVVKLDGNETVLPLIVHVDCTANVVLTMDVPNYRFVDDNVETFTATLPEHLEQNVISSIRLHDHNTF